MQIISAERNILTRRNGFAKRGGCRCGHVGAKKYINASTAVSHYSQYSMLYVVVYVVFVYVVVFVVVIVAEMAMTELVMAEMAITEVAMREVAMTEVVMSEAANTVARVAAR